jgi:ABC-2 type transport system permease protein
LKQKVLKQYGVSAIEELPVNFAGIALQASEDYGNAVFDKHYTRLWRIYEKQDVVRHFASALVPIEAVRRISMALAGTDFQEYRSFAIAAEKYRRQLNRMMNDALTFNSRGDGSIYGSRKDGAPYLGDASLWESVPGFQYVPLTLPEVLRQQFGNILWLTAWLLLMLVAAMWQAARLRT